MLFGHYAPAFLVQLFYPYTPLWALFVAVQLVDIFWAIFVLLGIEHFRIIPGLSAVNDMELTNIPYTHSLLLTFGWMLVSGAAWAAATGAPKACSSFHITGFLARSSLTARGKHEILRETNKSEVFPFREYPPLIRRLEGHVYNSHFSEPSGARLCRSVSQWGRTSCATLSFICQICRSPLGLAALASALVCGTACHLSLYSPARSSP